MFDIIKTQRSLARKAESIKDHQFENLYRLSFNRDWIFFALSEVLKNKGAKTPGVDGMTKSNYESFKSKQNLVEEIHSELKVRKFKPSPIRRVSIPKGNGQTRPLGISTLKDRTVQMLVKMILEPIWESHFLNLSNGFRPLRKTMDCIALLDSYINNRNKYFWVVEGDIRAAFDSIQHEILLGLIQKKVGDSQLIGLIRSFLEAGIMQNRLFIKSEVGTPQGTICSPLLANIYLHELDMFWWEKYGGLSQGQKTYRRITKKGNCGLIRYADDWLLLTNGGRSEAERLKEEFKNFLWKKLKLELAEEKTHVTHVNDGFDFLGFNIRRFTKSNDRPKMIVTPSNKSVAKLKSKVKEMTTRSRFRDPPLLKIDAINRILRGWIEYYKYCNSKKVAGDLDFWINQRVFDWLRKRHKATAATTMRLYKHREENRWNLGVEIEGKTYFLYRISDVKVTKHRSRKLRNPYITQGWLTPFSQAESPMKEFIWLGNESKNGWSELKARIKILRGNVCEECGNENFLDLHHLQSRKLSGQNILSNVKLLCRSCHSKTDSYGPPRMVQ